ncbi:MAG: DegV family protein [Faecousia sp.]
MSKIRIATDSTADIPKSFREELNIAVLPLTILAGDKEYRDGVDIQPSEFYKIIDASTKLPASSQVSATLYTQLFEETWKEGYTDLIHVTINSKGSGTYQAAVMSRDMFYEDHPEAKETLQIHILDSMTYSMSYGIPVIEAARMIRDGASLEAVLSFLEEWLPHARPMFVPLNLKCVKKSGRISPAAAFVGDAIGLKPLITFEDGEAKILSKARGENAAITALVQTCLKERKPGTSYAIVHGYNMEALDKLRKACAEVMDQPPLTEYEVGCVIGINTGPDMVGIIYRT